MPSTTGTAVAALAGLLLVGSLAASGASVDVSEDVEQQIKRFLEDTMRDLSVGWLQAVDAHGQVHNGSVEEIRLLVRPDGGTTSLDTHRLVLRSAQGVPVELTGMDVLRDEDGSVDDGVLNRGDLVELTLTPDQPLPLRDGIELVFHDPDHAPLHVILQGPRTADGLTRIDVVRSW